MPRRKLYIGTSGWVYGHWEGIFYPEDLSPKDKLKYFSKYFKTTEINYSFYHLPRPSTYQKWYLETPRDFIFAVKASRFITHVKRLKEVKEAWKTFIENALNLKEKLGPILFQFPSSFQETCENLKRLEGFLQIFRGSTSEDLRGAFEFRHESWCDEKVYNLFKKYKVAWVIADSPGWRVGWSPKAEVVTCDFVYVRMHGSKVLFSSNYTKKELENLTQKIKKWLSQNLDVYIYFNNDAMGYAIENAKELLKLCFKFFEI
jgi:uncharacterized protein YecE (DUF72 family)